MPEYSANSQERLGTCHDTLRRVFMEVIKTRDCTIVQGHRGEDEQNEMFRQGKSQLRWPRSKHNSSPSRAVDVGPYYSSIGIPWNEREPWIHFAGYVFAVADSLSVPLRWGGDWNGNLIFTDQNFHDLPHWELKDAD